MRDFLFIYILNKKKSFCLINNKNANKKLQQHEFK